MNRPLPFTPRRLVKMAVVVLVIVAVGAVIGPMVFFTPGSTANPGLGDRRVSEPRSIDAVGPLFAAGAEGPHYCTASVVHSPHGNVILTAAHCVSDPAMGMRFVPGYSGGRAPFGDWLVTKAYFDPRWLDHQDEDADYAFLTVEPVGGDRVHEVQRTLEDTVGANALDVDPPVDGARIRVNGYRTGTDDDGIECTAQFYREEGHPAFDCDGFVAGTSGSPWVIDSHRRTGLGRVIGVIGGHDEGGLIDSTSFSSVFDSSTAAVYRRAVAG